MKMHLHISLWLLLILFQTIGMVSGIKLSCEDTMEAPQLNDTIEPGTSLFSIDGFKEFFGCPISKCFNISDDNQTIILKESLTHYCGSLSCYVKCDPGGFPGARQLNATLAFQEIERYSNYSVRFSQPEIRLKVKENTAIGTNVLNQSIRVSANECSDGDIDTNAPRSFHIINNTNGLFKWGLETSDNSLTVQKNIDYETVQHVTLTLQAEIKYQQRLLASGTTLLEISIQDIDDNPPKFDHDKYMVFIPEENSTTENSFLQVLPEQIKANDLDKGINEAIVYSIEGSISNTFTINETTGEVRVLKPLDREIKDKYSIVLKASQKDKDYFSATATLIVSVTDIDDHLPVFSPDTYNATVSEHSPTWSYIVKVTAVDEDLGRNAEFTYKLANDSIPVTVDDKSGEIRVKSQQDFDRETYGDKIIAEVLTETYDNRKGNNTATVTILLADINDHNPEFLQPQFHFTTDNQTNSIIGQVAATDKDQGPNANVTYTFMSGTQTSTDCKGSSQEFPFELDALSGNISFKTSHLLCLTYSSVVEGCDNPTNAASRRCNFSKVVITSSTLQNQTKVINRTFEVFENMAKDQIVGYLPCTDPTYTYIYQGDNELYISTDSGLVFTNVSFDREDKDKYYGLVKVKDTNGAVICQISVTVLVQDVNDHAPRFEKNEYSFDLQEDITPGKIIGYVKATDDDVGENGVINYFLKQNEDYETFTLNTSTGTIYLGSSSILTKDVYHLLVGARDNGSPHLESLTSVFISNSSGDNYSIPLSTPLSSTAIYERKQQLENAMSSILNISVVISAVKSSSSADQRQKSVIYIAAVKNDSSSVTKTELQRHVLQNYEAIRAQFYQENLKTENSSSDKGLRAPEIALIVMAAVILIGAVVAIIIINNQFSNHKKYRRLYENLTRNSSIYESQEIKINMDDETSDYHGSLNTQDLENTETKSSENAAACVNPLFGNAAVSENDSGHLSDANIEAEIDASAVYPHRSNSEQALESLARLSDMLDKEDTEPILVTEEPQTKMDSNENECTKTSSELQNASQDLAENAHASAKTVDNDNQNLVEKSSEQNKSESPVNETEEPNPDYDVKQVRFHTEVLDTDENKFEPLNETEGRKMFPKSSVYHDTAVEVGASQNDMDAVFADTETKDDTKTTESLLEEATDEPGWVEEEINSPNTSVSLDDEGSSYLNADLEVSTHF